MSRRIPAVLVFSLLSVVVSAESNAQEAGERPASLWQKGHRGLSWAEVDSLQRVVREFHAEGAIGEYDLLIRNREDGLEVLIEAVIIDADRWAELRGIEPLGERTRRRPEGVARRSVPMDRGA